MDATRIIEPEHGSLSKVLASLPDAAVDALTARLRQVVRDYEKPAGLEFPGLNLIATGRRA